MRLRYEDALEEALAWSGWFCRLTGIVSRTRRDIEIGRRYWAEWRRIVDEDRRALLVGGDGEGLLSDYRFWRDAEPEFTIAVIRSRGLASPEAFACWPAGNRSRRRSRGRNSGRSNSRARTIR